MVLSKRFINDGVSIVNLNNIQRENLDSFRSNLKMIYKMESYACECGETDFEVLAEKDRYGLPNETVICKKCGLVMTNPRLSQNSYNKYYSNEYPKIYRALDKPDGNYFMDKVKCGKNILKFVEEHTELSGKEVLEIGCAAGGILKAFQINGYQVAGVDLSEIYTDYGKHLGLNLKCCNSKELLLEGKKYDLIIINHVLEHFTNLTEELDVVRQLLNPNGKVYVAVPGIKELANGSYHENFLLYLQNAHVYDFTLDTLAQVMRWNGFDLIYGNEKIESIFMIGGGEEKNNYYGEVIQVLRELEEEMDYIRNRLISIFSNYQEGEIAIYGVGRQAFKILDIVRAEQLENKLAGFFTNEKPINEKTFQEFPMLDIENISNIKCILISPKLYCQEIYERISYLLNQNIDIVKLFE